MNEKKWYTSKTLWFNVLTFVWKFIGPTVGIPVLDADIFAGILTVGNIILRLVTKGAVTIS